MGLMLLPQICDFKALPVLYVQNKSNIRFHSIHNATCKLGTCFETPELALTLQLQQC